MLLKTPKIKAFGLFYLFIFSQYAWAQSKVITEFSLSLVPGDYTDSVVRPKEKITGELARSLQDITIAKPYETKINGIKLNLEYSLDVQGPLSGPGMYHVLSNLKNVEVSFAKLRTKDILVQRQGAAIINVNIDGRCSDLKAVYSKQDMQVTGLVRFSSLESGSQLSLQSLDMIYEPKNWSFKIEKCTGPKGFDKVVKDNMLEFLGRKDQLLAAIRSSLEENLYRVAQQINRRIMTVQSFILAEGVELQVHPLEINLSDKGVARVGGLALVHFKKSTSNNVTQVSFANKVVHGKSQSELLFPEAFLQALSNAMYHNGIYNVPLWPQKDPRLKDLFANRFGLFFKWPDLLNFDKDANFLFQIYATQTPIYSRVVMREEKLWMNANVKLSNQMYVPRSNSFLPYVYFSAQSTLPMSIELIDGHGRLRFQEMNLHSQHIWNKDYVQQFNPDETLDRDFLEEELEKYLADTQIDFAVPTLDLQEIGQLYPLGFDSRNSTIVIRYGQTPQKKTEPVPPMPVVEYNDNPYWWMDN